nr:phosphoenolpyruvate--protein phosphotransferase [Caulobacter sp. 17J80-11]
MILSAPLKGWVAPLSEAPDAVFAEGMMGDGLAIDPTGSTLHAPCDGEVVSVARTRHAVTLRAANGAEILMHVGLETVALGGEGFEAHVADGQAVKAGDRLLSFDLDLLARKAKSLLTPVVITNGELFSVARRDDGREGAVGDFLMELRLAQPGAAQAADAKGPELSQTLACPLPHGIHARPAAALGACARRFAAEAAISANGRRADVRSVVALMALGVKAGDEIVVSARGKDAAAAVDALAELIRSGMGEAAHAAPAAPVALAVKDDGDPTRAMGVTGVPGLAVGRAVRFVQAEIAVAEKGEGAGREHAELTRARGVVRRRLEAAAAEGGRERADILAAHLALLDDPALVGEAQARIERGESAGFAWRAAVRAQAEALKALGDARMAERVGDLLDLERQVLTVLAGDQVPTGPGLPPETVLIADDLLPSQFVGLDLSRLAGICLARGGPTAHVVILAAAQGVPTVVAAGPRVMDVAEGAPVILDATKGVVHLKPSKDEVETVRGLVRAHAERRSVERAAARQDCVTVDGARIEVFANLGAASEAAAAVEGGAEGCGLLRTEFLFLDRATPPDEDEQFAQYQAVATGLAGRPLIVRTLDAGGDKPLAYLPLPHEDNPALGLRGVRTGLHRPDLLKTQLRAILRVRPVGQCRIMLPMVASLAELRAVRAMLDEIRAQIGRKEPAQLGIMVETPASALLADQLAAEADFLSIGTNDLTQYVLAMDRGHPQLASQLDSLHPAVLRLIKAACDGGSRNRRWVGVCGGLASDPVAAPILIGLGVTELSAAPSAVPGLKAVIRDLRASDCRAVASRALDLTSAAEVRALVLKTWPAIAERV